MGHNNVIAESNPNHKTNYKTLTHAQAKQRLLTESAIQ